MPAGARGLLALAAVCDGMSRADAARIGGMDRRALRDWVHRFNAGGCESLHDRWTDGEAALAARGDLKEVTGKRFGAVHSARPVPRIPHQPGFSHLRAGPCHPAPDKEADRGF